MTMATRQRRVESAKDKDVGTTRLFVAVAGAAIAVMVMWILGITTDGWWKRFTTPKAAPAAIIPPPRLPSTPIGIVPPRPLGNDSSISRTPLALTLVEVQPGRNATEGSAKIGVVKESPQTYQAGAVLENGARLAEIHSDYVLLRKGSSSTRLYLDSADHKGKVGNLELLTVGGERSHPMTSPVTSREVFTDYIRPNPVFDQTVMVGYEVFPGVQQGPFMQMGLKPGDIIVDIAGTPLVDAETSWGLFRSIADGAVLAASIKRQGAVQQVTLDGTMIVRAEGQRQDASRPL